jgi:hypothetical protein
MKNEKIKSLTENQIEKLSIYRDKWIRIGTSTFDNNDRKMAEKYINDVYSIAGLEPPKFKIWLSSPYSGVIGFVLLKQVMEQVGDKGVAQVIAQVIAQIRAQVVAQFRAQVGDKVWSQALNQIWFRVGNQVGYQVRNQVSDQVKNQVKNHVDNKVENQVWFRVGNKVGDKVRDQALNKIWFQVGNQVMDQVGEHIMTQVWAKTFQCGYGIYDVNFLSFYDYFDNEVLYNLNKIRPLINLSKYVGWWWPFENVVIFTDKPIFVCCDDRGRLHHENRMALEYSDGFGIYSWHGIRVSEQIIMKPETIRLDQVVKENNQEIRRVMLDRYGWDRVLYDLCASVEHEDNTGKLISTYRLGEYLDGEDEIAKFVLVVDPSTNRKYSLRVPPETKTAREGVAWTFGQKEDEYNPIKET